MMLEEIRFTGYDLRGIRGSIDKAIKRLEDIEAIAPRIREVDYVATAWFEATERYVWVIDIFVKFTLADNSHSYIKVYSGTMSKKNPPSNVHTRILELQEIYKVQSIYFDPAIWRWKEDGHLSRWVIV